METKLFDSELKVMGVLWREGETTAKCIAQTLTEEVGWNRNTTYTLIKRCIQKGAIERLEPNFRCRALVSQETVQRAETAEMVGYNNAEHFNRMFKKITGMTPSQYRKQV